MDAAEYEDITVITWRLSSESQGATPSPSRGHMLTQMHGSREEARAAVGKPGSLSRFTHPVLGPQTGLPATQAQSFLLLTSACLWPEASLPSEEIQGHEAGGCSCRSHLPREKVRRGSDNSDTHHPSTEGFHVASLLPRLPGILGGLALCFDLENSETLRRSGWKLHLFLSSILSN